MDREEQIKQLEEELSKTKYNKKTQHHIGLVKAKIAKLKEQIIKKSKGKGKTYGYTIKKTGDGTAVMLGFPSVGKSTLLNKLTNAKSKIGSYEFTTLSVVPGLLNHKHAKIQIFDVPGIVKGASDGTGRGKEVLAAIRAADLIMIVLDVNRLDHLNILLKEVYNTGIRLNKTKPVVKITKKSKGGINISKTVKLNMTDETIKAILKEFRYNNVDVLIRTKITEDEFIDVLENNKIYIPGITVINKIDSIETTVLEEITKEVKNAVCVSATKSENIEKLKDIIYTKMNFISIYLKEIMNEVDKKEPLVMKKNAEIKDVCNKLHRNFLNRFRFARVWGKSAKYDGQKITAITHRLENEDIVELHLR